MTSENKHPFHIAAGAAIIVGIAATLWGFFSLDGFWEDEIFQVAFLNEALPHFFVQVARLDQHPPFHFLQLKLWAQFFSSDKGLLLNSVAWHLVSCLAIFLVGRWWLGTTVGLLAAAFFALVPQAIYASVNLRMYAMIPALAVTVWWLNIKLLTTNEKRWWPWIALLGVQLALGYSHAIAVYFVAWIVLAAIVQVLVEHRDSVNWKRWLSLQAISAILLLPLVASALIRIGMADPNAVGGNSNPGNAITHLGGMVAGWGMKWEYGKQIGACFYALTVIVGLSQKTTRWISLTLLIGPYFAASIIELLFAPMFKTPIYSAMLIPFACLALSGGLLQLNKTARLWGGIALLGIMAVAVFPVSQHLLTRNSPYKPIVAELQRQVREGDVVVVPKPYLYWAVMRYAVASNWGSPLEVLPPLSDSWRRVIGKLGPEWTRLLKLGPRTNQISSNGITYVIGEEAVANSANATRVWVVRRVHYPELPKLSEGFLDHRIVAEHGFPEKTQLILFEKTVLSMD